MCLLELSFTLLDQALPLWLACPSSESAGTGGVGGRTGGGGEGGDLGGYFNRSETAVPPHVALLISIYALAD